ncbi:MAG: hypothetical protein ACI9VR_003609 [Cognaticolwellia sp.]|jgi:hypothetical protein
MVGLSLILACATVQTQGIVELTTGGVLLHSDERDYELQVEGEMVALRAMDDCTVSVDGVRRGRALRVQDYRVIAAQDGSAPFVGVLRQNGDKVDLILRGSGMRLVMVGPGAELLEPYVGQPVMVLGFASGPHELTVMGYTPLEP